MDRRSFIMAIFGGAATAGLAGTAMAQMPSTAPAMGAEPRSTVRDMPRQGGMRPSSAPAMGAEPRSTVTDAPVRRRRPRRMRRRAYRPDRRTRPNQQR